MPPAAPLRRVRATLHALGRGLTALAFPPACVACAAALDGEGLPLCPACLAALDDVPPGALAAHLAPIARLDAAHAAWRYDPDGPLGALFHEVKYGHRPRYARLLGRALATRLPAFTADALVPVPLTRARYLERGYNQAEEIARGLGEVLALPVCPGLLRRGAFTRSQTRLGRGARQANVAHAFAAAPDAHACHLVLVDDVVTTGATTGAAADTLRAAGAASVGLVAVAWTR